MSVWSLIAVLRPGGLLVAPPSPEDCWSPARPFLTCGYSTPDSQRTEREAPTPMFGGFRCLTPDSKKKKGAASKLLTETEGRPLPPFSGRRGNRVAGISALDRRSRLDRKGGGKHSGPEDSIGSEDGTEAAEVPPTGSLPTVTHGLPPLTQPSQHFGRRGRIAPLPRPPSPFTRRRACKRRHHHP